MSPLPAGRGASAAACLDCPCCLSDRREEVIMASQSAQPATNERIMRLLEDVNAQLAD